MSRDESPQPRNAAILASLTDEQRDELYRTHDVKTGDDLVWIEPEGGIRREKAAALYYIRTGRGVFRVSRISEKVVEV